MSWLSEFLGFDAAEVNKRQQEAAQNKSNALSAQSDAQFAAAQQAQAAQNASIDKQQGLTDTAAAQWQAFDPNAFAAQQTQAASNAAASAARGAGANAGKAARLGNVGIQNAAANAIGQGYGIQGNLADRALGAQSNVSSQYGGAAGTAGQLGSAAGGLAQGWSGQEMARGNEETRKRENVFSGIGEAGKTVGKAVAIPGMEKGGEVKSGEVYKVGENGEEIFTPKVDGTIIPNEIVKELSPAGKKLMKRFLDDVYPQYKKMKAA